MRISINGEHTQTQSKTLAALVEEKTQTATAETEVKKMAVAVNGSVVLRQHWSEYEINENDVIDVFQAVAGG